MHNHIAFLVRLKSLAGGRILERNWDKSLKSFLPCYSQSPLLTDFTPPSPLEQKWFEIGL
jgi:hypothetical protein